MSFSTYAKNTGNPSICNFFLNATTEIIQVDAIIFKPTFIKRFYLKRFFSLAHLTVFNFSIPSEHLEVVWTSFK